MTHRVEGYVIGEYIAEGWSLEELELVERYFDGNMSRKTLFLKISAVNPNRSYEAVCRKIRHLKEKAGYRRNQEVALDKLRVGYFDIEATNLNADFGFCLCWYIKAQGKEVYHGSCIRPEEIRNCTGDKRVISELLDAFDSYDILYTHYGSDRRFDVPYIRTRALYHGFDEKLTKIRGEKFIRDTWITSRNKLKMSRNSLWKLQDLLHIESSKTSLNPEAWVKACMGHGPSLDYIFEHCKCDVKVLEEVQQRLAAIEKPTFNGI